MKTCSPFVLSMVTATLLTCSACFCPSWRGADTDVSDACGAYRHSSDGSLEVLYVAERTAVLRHLSHDTNGIPTLRFTVARAHWGEEPEDACSTGDHIDVILVEDVTHLSEIATGEGVVALGYKPAQDPDMGFDELVRMAGSRRKSYFWIDSSNSQQMSTSAELDRVVSEKTGRGQLRFEYAEVFFRRATEAALITKRRGVGTSK